MAGIKTLLGLFPKTSEYEAKLNALEKEYKAIYEFESSEELSRYKELEEFINSNEFKSTQKDLLNLKYKDSEEYRKESQLNQLKKDKNLKLYLRTLSSETLANYNKTYDSDTLKEFEELQTYVESEEFNKVKRHYALSAKKRFQKSDLGDTLAKYVQQKNLAKFKAYKKFVNHKLYQDFSSIEGSDRLKKFKDLQKLVNSSEFLQKKSSMKKSDFEISEEGEKYSEYLRQKKSTEISNYLKHAKSTFKLSYDDLHGSDELEAFIELEKFIESVDFKSQKDAIERKTFKDTSEYSKFEEYVQLKNNPQIQSYNKFKKSKEFQNFNNIKESDLLKRYEELQEYVKTENFIERKKYLTLPAKVRWQQSEAYSKEQEFYTLKKTDKIVWYFKNKGHKKFSWFETWDLSFEDNFDTGKLDRKKWITRYFWGEELMKESYSLANEKHCITDGDNLEFNGSILKITTRKEVAEGKIWNPELGFEPHTFNYSSGLINTGKSFRQKYGLFEAKIRVSDNNNLLNAFWMVGDQMFPHIDVFKAYKKCSVGIFENESKIQRSFARNRFSSEFHIVSLEWEQNRITWKINGLEVTSTHKNIPQNELYLVFSSGLYKNVTNVPASMEIDWVKCFQKK